MIATVTPLLWIDFTGDETRPASLRPRALPVLPNDHGLITRMYAWLDAEGMSVAKLARIGGGAFSLGFLPADGERVVAWLAEQGVIVDRRP